MDEHFVALYFGAVIIIYSGITIYSYYCWIQVLTNFPGFAENSWKTQINPTETCAWVKHTGIMESRIKRNMRCLPLMLKPFNNVPNNKQYYKVYLCVNLGKNKQTCKQLGWCNLKKSSYPALNYVQLPVHSMITTLWAGFRLSESLVVYFCLANSRLFCLELKTNKQFYIWHNWKQSMIFQPTCCGNNPPMTTSLIDRIYRED